MSANAPQNDAEHPLLADQAFLDDLLDIMYATIHQVLERPNPGLVGETGRRRGGGHSDRPLAGTGTSAEDILQDAFAALLTYPLDKREHSWKSLAIGIAKNKTKQALRTSQKGVRATEHRPELSLISGDAEFKGADDETDTTIFELISDERYEPEAEYLAIRDVLDLRDLALEKLGDRERNVYFEIHFNGRSRKEVGEHLHLSPQRVGQIYKEAEHRLRADPGYPYTNI